MKFCILSRGVPDEKSPLNGRYEWAQAELLTECGFDVTFLAVDLRRFHWREKIGYSRFEKHGIDVVLYRIPIGKAKKNFLIKLRRLVCVHFFNKMKKNNELPDVVWVYFARSFGEIAYFVKRKLQIPYAISEYETRLLDYNCSKKETNKLCRIYSNALLLFAPNGYFKDKLNAKFEVGFNTLYPFVKVEESQKQENKNYVFLCISPLTVESRIDVVIRAFAKITELIENVKLTIVGNGDEYRRLLELSVTLKLSNKVNFTRLLDGISLHEYMNNSNCLVSTLKKENYGVLYLEAFAHGLPCIAVKNKVAIDLIKENVGITVNNDVTSVANGMFKVYSERMKFSPTLIKKYAFDNFSDVAICKKISFLLKNNLASFDN